jgi:hypothetical protein
MRGGDLSSREERIRERAHQLWQQAGEPAGRHEEFWRQAEAEIDTADDRAYPPRGA